MVWKCKQCGLCCSIFSMDLAKPLTEEEMKFFNSHKNMFAVDKNILAFKGKCKHLGYKNGKHYCKIHSKRPKWCREFNEEHCKAVHSIKKKIDTLL